jgi:hypothetical protein
MRRSQPKIIEYTNLLHRYGESQSTPVRTYLQKHQSDPQFLRHSAILNRLFELRTQVLCQT